MKIKSFEPPKSIRNYKKQTNLECQTLGRQVVYPIGPANQCIILQIVRFLVSTQTFIYYVYLTANSPTASTYVVNIPCTCMRQLHLQWWQFYPTLFSSSFFITTMCVWQYYRSTTTYPNVLLCACRFLWIQSLYMQQTRGQ